MINIKALTAVLRNPSRHLSLVAASGCVLAAASSAHSQTLLEISTTADGGQEISTQIGPSLLGGQLAGLSYGFPPMGPGLTIRPAQPMLCARWGQQGNNPLKKVVFDPNGYFAPIELAEEAFVENRGEVIYGSGAFLRASEAIDFANSAFVTVDGQLAFDVSAVRAYCFLVPPVDVQPVASACETSESEDVFGGGFEAELPGSLQITATSQLQPPLNNELQYEYVIQATGGSVYDVRIREQFPYFSVQTPPSTPPVFGKSLALEENWSCQASDGARCDSRGVGIDGAGYVHLDGGKLAEGSCIKISTSRDLRINGTEQGSFSGRLHLGAIYTTAPTPTGSAQVEHESIRQPFATQ